MNKYGAGKKSKSGWSWIGLEDVLRLYNKFPLIKWCTSSRSRNISLVVFSHIDIDIATTSSVGVPAGVRTERFQRCYRLSRLPSRLRFSDFPYPRTLATSPGSNIAVILLISYLCFGLKCAHGVYQLSAPSVQLCVAMTHYRIVFRNCVRYFSDHSGLSVVSAEETSRCDSNWCSQQLTKKSAATALNTVLASAHTLMT
jgi:hypothetical protein